MVGKRAQVLGETDADVFHPDDFVDDSELAWEQQAAASKDGFFGQIPTPSFRRITDISCSLLWSAGTRRREACP